MGNCMCIPSGKVRSKLQALKHVPHTVSSLFDEYAGEKGVLDAEDLQKILNAQGISSSEGQAKELISKYQTEVSHEHHHLHLKGHTMKRAREGRSEMDLAGFFALLSDPDLNPLHPVSQVTQDMSQPLSQYFWYTSHNSYLSGNQLTSDSSAVPIVDALRRGCRVIELDVWPDGDKIKVVHGMTLCKPAPVIDLLQAIKESAFVASEYPVVLTIENHLPPLLQKLLAQLLVEILGDALFVPPSDLNGPLLSPNDLVRRFLISDKPITETEEGVKGAKKASGEAASKADDFLREGELDETEGAANGAHSASAAAGFPGVASTGFSNGAPKEEEAEAVMSATVANTAVPEYEESFSSLIYIPCLKPNEYVGTFKSSKRVTMANVSEPAFEKLAESGPTLLTKFAKHNVMRVYPYGLRFDSSNLDPTMAWSHGAQLAAINMQGYGRHLWLQHGLFSANGGCGYVKKPDFFYPPEAIGGEPAVEFNPSAKRPVQSILKIRIIAGRDTHKRFDALKPPDFFVRIAIYGVPADKKKHHTKTHRNTKHPIWEKEDFEFPLTVPELALLAIEVRESDTLQRDDFACQTCIPVTELRNGLRAVAMKDKKGNVIPDGHAKLLVHVDLVNATGAGATRILETPSMRESAVGSANLEDVSLK